MRTAWFLFLMMIFLTTIVGAQMGTGNMGQGMSGMMILSGNRPYRADGKILQIDDAIAIAQQYLVSSHASSLALDEIEEWEYNFYVVVKEVAPSNYKAYQLVIDKWTGWVQFEPGPNMMWNSKYCWGSMMGCGNQSSQRITPGDAVAAANKFLSQRLPGLVVASTTPDVFHGFYTFDVKKANAKRKMGMLSVNWNTGQVWYHTWHGRFIKGREL